MDDQTPMHLSGLYDLAEASRLTGLSVEALRKRISRGKLEQIKGNDGSIRVRLTSADREAIARTATGHASGREMSEVQTVPDTSLHERAARAEGEVARLVEDRNRAIRELGSLGERVAGLEQRLSNTAAALTAAKVHTAAVEAEAIGLRTALAKAERPWWRKMLGT